MRLNLFVSNKNRTQYSDEKINFELFGDLIRNNYPIFTSKISILHGCCFFVQRKCRTRYEHNAMNDNMSKMRRVLSFGNKAIT